MAGRVKSFFKNFDFKKNKISVLLSLFVFILIAGLNVAFAFYNDEITSVVLTSKVGNFGFSDSDVGIVYYKEVEDNKFERVFQIPDAFYKFDDSKTECNIDCNLKDGDNNIIEDQTCKYTYIPSNTGNFITLTSTEKVSCKFYFMKFAETDVITNILLENENGLYEDPDTHKKYDVTDNIPEEGYNYRTSSCTNGATIDYDQVEKQIVVESEGQDTCFVYFDKVAASE